MQPVFDIEVPKSHNFILSNGIVAHNCAHATNYSYLSYLTAWLKYHYPTEFMTAIINSKDANSDKVQEYKQLAKSMGITILPPDINTSSANYEVVKDKMITTGIMAIKGIGEEAVQHIVSHRPYTNFMDFIVKSTGTKGNRSPITKTVIEALAKAGCLDSLKITRKNALEHWQDIKEKAVAATKKAAKKEIAVDFSGVMGEMEQDDEYDKKTILQNEMEVIGHYLSGDHNDVYGGFFKNSPDLTKFSSIKDLPSGKTIKIEAIVKVKIKELKIKNKKSKSFGRSFGKYLIEDTHGTTAEITLWPEYYDKYRNILIDGLPFKALVEINEYMDSKSLLMIHIENAPGKVVNGKIINSENK